MGKKSVRPRSAVSAARDGLGILVGGIPEQAKGVRGKAGFAFSVARHGAELIQEAGKPERGNRIQVKRIGRDHVDLGSRSTVTSEFLPQQC
jgi:hypothetical protein